MLVPLILQNLQASGGGLAATSAIQQGAEVIEASATIASVASSAITQSPETLSAAATVASNASSAIEHRPESLTAVAGAALAGNSAITQSPESLAVASSNAVSGSSTVSQLADTIQADGTAALSASSDIQQLSDSLETSGTLSAAAGINADVAIVLGAIGFEVSAGFEVLPSGGGGETGTYPGYAADITAKQSPEPAEPIDQPKPVKPVRVQAQPVATQTDGQALRRMVNASLRDKQMQALGELRLALQAQQAEQQRLIQLQINDDDDALMALLLT